MSYQSAIDQLNAMVPELYSKPGQPRRKFSLDEIGLLLETLGNPHKKFPSVLIAGTNGKGSTAATLASILASSGLRSSLFTSPHLKRPNERIQVGGAEIADDDFARLFFRVSGAARQLVLENKLLQSPSFFETLTAMAFLHFAEERVDLAVLEVGMGGRLDATNIVDPLLSVITDISLDHTEWLGSTIAAITREKAGILRRDGTLITLPQHPEANQVMGEMATDLGVRGVSAVPYMPPSSNRTETLSRVADGAWWQNSYCVEVLGQEITVASPLRGAHQYRNVALAIAAAVELAKTQGFPVTPSSIAGGIRQTRWPARLERIPGNDRQWVLDVAHNPAGAWALRAGLGDLLRHGEPDAKPATLVFSCLRDKPVAEMAQILFPLFDRVIFAPIHSLRATPMSDLLAAAQSTGAHATVAESVAEAIELAIDAAPPGSVIVVSGSVYLVGEARSLLLAQTQQPVGAEP